MRAVIQFDLIERDWGVFQIFWIFKKKLASFKTYDEAFQWLKEEGWED